MRGAPGSQQAAAPWGCVLAGGRSSRMGQDKAMLLQRGRPLVQHALELLRAAGCEAHIVGPRPDLAPRGPVIADLHPGCGPLGGIEAALSAKADAADAEPLVDDRVLFVPVDLPLLPAGFLRMLLGRSGRTGALATVPFVGGRPQPLCAVYRVGLLPGIQASLASGDYKVMRVLEAVAPRRQRDFFGVEAVLAAQAAFDEPKKDGVPAHRWFANINTPEDLLSLG